VCRLLSCAGKKPIDTKECKNNCLFFILVFLVTLGSDYFIGEKESKRKEDNRKVTNKYFSYLQPLTLSSFSHFLIESQIKTLSLDKISQRMSILNIFCLVSTRKSYEATLWKNFSIFRQFLDPPLLKTIGNHD
jgi:hypothetical protein